MKSMLETKNNLWKVMGILSFVVLMSGFMGISASQADISMTDWRWNYNQEINYPPLVNFFYQDSTSSATDIGPLDPGSYTMQIGIVSTFVSGVGTNVANNIDGGLSGVKITDALNNTVITFDVGPGPNGPVGQAVTNAFMGEYSLSNGTVGALYSTNAGALAAASAFNMLTFGDAGLLNINATYSPNSGGWAYSSATLSQASSSVPELPAGLMAPLLGALALGMLWMRKRFALVS